MWSLEWALIDRMDTLVSLSCEKRLEHQHTQRKDDEKTQRGEDSHVQAKDRVFRRNQPRQHLISDYWPLKL